MTSVFVVTEGELYHHPWLVHGVWTEEQPARDYRAQLVKAIDGQRWPNVQLWEFELNVPGHVEYDEGKI
jgi:hypothetical protein